jgi:hypothetical protein
MKDARSYAIELKDKMTDLIASIESNDSETIDEVMDECYIILEDISTALIKGD